jgi:hypothetical protein
MTRLQSAALLCTTCEHAHVLEADIAAARLNNSINDFLTIVSVSLLRVNLNGPFTMRCAHSCNEEGMVI